MIKGDIVLIPFPFSDLTGSKLRPAIVLIAAQLDITVYFITSQLKWQEPTDIRIQPSSENGLKRPSLIRLSEMATLEKALSVGRLGRLEQHEIEVLNC